MEKAQSLGLKSMKIPLGLSKEMTNGKYEQKIPLSLSKIILNEKTWKTIF